MTIQRAVVKGRIGGVIEIRNMFTCDVIESGGDTYAILWDAYLTSIYDVFEDIVSNVVSTYEYELQEWTLGSWVPFDTEDFAHTGINTGDQLPNIVSIVLIAKAAGLRHIGRKFFGPIGEGETLANSLVAGTFAIAANALLAYITPFTGIGGGTITPGVLDKGGFFHPFVGGVVSSLLGSMRRRKPGVGI